MLLPVTKEKKIQISIFHVQSVSAKGVPSLPQPNENPMSQNTPTHPSIVHRVLLLGCGGQRKNKINRGNENPGRFSGEIELPPTPLLSTAREGPLIGKGPSFAEGRGPLEIVLQKGLVPCDQMLLPKTWGRIICWGCVFGYR